MDGDVRWQGKCMSRGGTCVVCGMEVCMAW